MPSITTDINQLKEWINEIKKEKPGLETFGDGSEEYNSYGEDGDNYEFRVWEHELAISTQFIAILRESHIRDAQYCPKLPENEDNIMDDEHWLDLTRGSVCIGPYKAGCEDMALTIATQMFSCDVEAVEVIQVIKDIGDHG